MVFGGFLVTGAMALVGLSASLAQVSRKFDFGTHKPNHQIDVQRMKYSCFIGEGLGSPQMPFAPLPE